MMANPQRRPSVSNIVGTITAVAGGAYVLGTMGMEELRHRKLKKQTDPTNVYSSIRILPDLMQFQGFIRIFKHTGKVITPVPLPIKQVDPNTNENDDVENDTNDNNDNNGNNNNDTNANSTCTDIKQEDHDDDDGNNDILGVNKETKGDTSSILSSLSMFASSSMKRVSQIMNDFSALSEDIKFESDFPLILRDSAIENIERYILENDRYIELFEETVHIDVNNKNKNTDDSDDSKETIKLNAQWEYCAVKVHHESLYIHYAKKWINLPLSNVIISSLNLQDNNALSHITDYDSYFTIFDSFGFTLLCQHLSNIEFENCIEIPELYSKCPWYYVQQNALGYHISNYISYRKKQVIDMIVRDVSNAMKDEGFNNISCSKHCMQFRQCLSATIETICKQKNIDIPLDNAPDNDDDEYDTDNDIEMDKDNAGNEGNEASDNEMKENEQKEEKDSFYYLNLLDNPDHGLHSHELSVIEWTLSSQSAFLSNYVYHMIAPILGKISENEKGIYSQFKSYMSSSSLLKQNVNNKIDKNTFDDNDDIIDEQCVYRGPQCHFNDKLWQKHSTMHYNDLAEHGFELLDYASTEVGQTTQWMLVRSFDNPNTIFLVFKGTSNPLDAMVNVGIHPIFWSSFECSVFSGMFAGLQQSLKHITRRLNVYSREEYWQNNACPPSNANDENTTRIHRLIVCGHSLGGGYAQLMLMHILSIPEVSSYFEDTQCITFGAPLVVCKDVSDSFLYSKLVDRCLHFVYQFDLVPRMSNAMSDLYRKKLLQGLLLSHMPVSGVGMVIDINQRLDYILNKIKEHQWLMDMYCCIGKYVILFEKFQPKSIDSKNRCFVKSCKGQHLGLDSDTILKFIPSQIKDDEAIYATQIMNDHKMVNYMKTIMFQQC